MEYLLFKVSDQIRKNKNKKMKKLKVGEVEDEDFLVDFELYNKKVSNLKLWLSRSNFQDTDWIYLETFSVIICTKLANNTRDLLRIKGSEGICVIQKDYQIKPQINQIKRSLNCNIFPVKTEQKTGTE